MRTALLASILFISFVVLNCSKDPNDGDPPVDPPVETKADMNYWLTQPDQTALFKKQTPGLNFSNNSNASISSIEVDSAVGYQTMDGFGYCLTGGSASLINVLPSATKDALLQELFGNDSSSIGVSYLRVSIGASDLSATTFTYDDMPAGQTDPTLQQFSIDKEKQDLLPVLKKIVSIQPGIKILGSPWSAPTWMKSNNNFVGGSLKTEYYEAYAKYFVKYIQAMKAEGITIDAITVQNEPLHGGNNPSMLMTATEQANFIKNNLGPAFQAAAITTKIIAYDHNADRPDYPLTVLQDANARQYVDGSAFHLYGGDISALTQVHDAYPDKNIYFTEQWTGGPGNFSGDLKWHVQQLIIGASRNWSRNVLEWNLAADPYYDPHTPGGCSTCMGALTIGSTVTRNVSYYIIAHASKFVRPGSVRISSTQTNTLSSVAFREPSGKKVLIVLNNGSSPEVFSIKYKGRYATSSLNNGAVATYVW